MIIKRLRISDRDILRNRLIGRVFHLTPRAAYDQILKAGEISNNQSGSFPINVGSIKSYGRLSGCVCLFDLRNSDPEIIENTLQCYYFLGPTWFSKHGRKYITWDLAYFFLDPKYFERLIPSSRVEEHYRKTGEYLQAVPKSEVWIENKLPLSWVKTVLLVTVKETAPDRNTPAGRHYWAVHKAWEKRKR